MQLWGTEADLNYIQSHVNKIPYLKPINYKWGTPINHPHVPTAPRECFVCGHLAEYECLQCLPDRKLQPGRIKQYCTTCNLQVNQMSHCKCPSVSTSHVKTLTVFLFVSQVHTHPSRHGHSPKALEVPANVAPDAPVPRHMMQLFAVLCIQTSHYVSFVKYGPNPQSWLFFDSMADRCGKMDFHLFLLMGVLTFYSDVCTNLFWLFYEVVSNDCFIFW